KRVQNSSFLKRFFICVSFFILSVCKLSKKKITEIPMEPISSQTHQTLNVIAAKFPPKSRIDNINSCESGEHVHSNTVQHKAGECGALTSKQNDHRPCASRAFNGPQILSPPVTRILITERANVSSNDSVRRDSENASTALLTRKAPTKVMQKGDLQFSKNRQMMSGSVKHHRKQLEKCHYSELSFDDTTKFVAQVNTVFLKRLREMDQKVPDNIKLKLITYRDWVKMLLKVNQLLISNMEKLDFEIAKQLKRAQQWSADCCRSETREYLKCRKDIDSLIKLIQNVYYDNNWDTKSPSLKTMSTSQIFGNIEKSVQNIRSTAGTVDRLLADVESRRRQECNIKVLTTELGTKQEEVENIKKQISLMEDKMQHVQKEIELKDEIIKKLDSTDVTVPKSDVRSFLSQVLKFFSSKFLTFK
uniref:Uncharacterized protein n=1 Tax=Glossina morsitans morsitans TaxID=37546 RepID=A0A1B0GEE4_GLOMM